MPRPREPSCCLCQLVYPAIIQSAFGLFSCKTLADDSEMFNSAPHLDCKSDEALVGRAVAAASLGIWGVGFPLFLGTLIHRFAGNPQYSFTIVSYGYKSSLRFWEAWECLKKFGILLIITLLRRTPELAAIILLLFLNFAMLTSALSEPFIGSLINKAHLACDFLIFFVLLAGLLSTCAGQKWPEEVEILSIFVVSYAACLFAGLVAILWVETGSIFHRGGRRHALWDSFAISSHGSAVVAAKRLSQAAAKRLSRFMSFSPAIVPEPATASVEHMAVELSTAAELEPSPGQTPGRFL